MDSSLINFKKFNDCLSHTFPLKIYPSFELKAHADRLKTNFKDNI